MSKNATKQFIALVTVCCDLSVCAFCAHRSFSRIREKTPSSARDQILELLEVNFPDEEALLAYAKGNPNRPLKDRLKTDLKFNPISAGIIAGAIMEIVQEEEKKIAAKSVQLLEQKAVSPPPQLTLSVSECKVGTPSREACPRDKMVGMNEFLEKAVKTVEEQLPLVHDPSGAYRKPPFVISRVARGGKTTAPAL